MGDGRGRDPTAISVGTRPTFYDDGVRLVEAFLLDFDGDLYGQHASVRFLHHIRPQQKYDSMDTLMTQLHLDVERAPTPVRPIVIAAGTTWSSSRTNLPSDANVAEGTVA